VTAKLKTHTLGCKVNQYETQYVREGLLGIGYQDADDSEPADLCIVNTCTVTSEGDSKSRQIIRRMHRKNPDARIVVMGCYATRAPDEVAALPGVAEVISNKRELPDLLGRFGVVDIPNGITGLSNRHRAYVKVQDGCLLKCSYCIIPSVRPEMYSRPMNDVLDEVRRLVDRGYREVILTGIHLGHYGVDFNQGKSKSDWIRLSRLVAEICQIPGDFRVRLSSIECTEVTRELIRVMQEFPEKVCPHLHICVQSGSDSVLRRMKRRWTSRHIIDRCQLVKESLNRPALTTDVIVGFPGETEAEFQDSLNTCREIGFSKIHMFPFSARKTTPAAEMEGQISKALKTERGKQVAQLETICRERYAESLVGTKVRMLVEDVAVQDHAVLLSGTACRYLPTVIKLISESSIQQELTSPRKSMSGQLVDVQVEKAQGDRLVGVMI